MINFILIYPIFDAHRMSSNTKSTNQIYNIHKFILGYTRTMFGINIIETKLYQILNKVIIELTPDNMCYPKKHSRETGKIYSSEFQNGI